MLLQHQRWQPLIWALPFLFSCDWHKFKHPFYWTLKVKQLQQLNYFSCVVARHYTCNRLRQTDSWQHLWPEGIVATGVEPLGVSSPQVPPCSPKCSFVWCFWTSCSVDLLGDSKSQAVSSLSPLIIRLHRQTRHTTSQHFAAWRTSHSRNRMSRSHEYFEYRCIEM